MTRWPTQADRYVCATEAPQPSSAATTKASVQKTSWVRSPGTMPRSIASFEASGASRLIAVPASSASTERMALPR